LLEILIMLSSNYTAENICRALGLGGFANDLELAEADQCIRILLVPSFHREVCISVLRKADKVWVSVVAALTQIWLQDWPFPRSTPVEHDSSVLAGTEFVALSSSMHAAVESKPARRFVMLDGMRAYAVLRADRQGKLYLDQHVSADARYTSFVAEAITLAHRAIASPGVRNALSDAGSYAGLQIPIESTPPAKDIVRTLVLGREDETAPLLDALRKKHGFKR
jgi:hypothetical protein